MKNKKSVIIYIFIGVFFMTVSAKEKNKTLFVLTQENMPPFGASERLATNGEYEQEICFLFSNNSNVKDFIPVIYTNKKYSKLTITDLYLWFNNEPYILMGFANLILPQEVNESGGWVSNGDYYWLNGFFAKPEKPNHPLKVWPNNIDFNEIFKDKLYSTEKFKCYIEIYYYFDDNEKDEKYLKIEYEVEPRKLDY